MRMSRCLPALLIALSGAAFTLVSSAARAQAMADPTRPPNAALAPTAAGETDPVPTGPHLQSVLLPKAGGGRPRALISGEWVELGRNYGDMRVVKISVDRVEMAGPQGREILRLMPDAERQPAAGKRDGKRSQGSTR